MKKILLSSLIATCLLSATIPGRLAFAKENSVNTPDIESSSLEKELDHKYNYDGLTIESNIKLNEADLQRIQSEVTHSNIPKKLETNDNSNRGIVPFGPVQSGTYTGSIIRGPVERINTNKNIKEIANVFVAWIGTHLPTKFTKSIVANYFFNKMTGWDFKPTYTSEWISRASYTYNHNYWQYFATIVRHSDSDVDNPTDVAYYSLYTEKK
ncbi:hypothetical protein [Marinilactibacillus psychrotolerans]|nr:hypothetical protein [Marinilactibacillus psychrotolerans]GEQ33344.1 hypothetical protein B795N_12260 [Marinilactibacillus psychrotolerans]